MDGMEVELKGQWQYKVYIEEPKVSERILFILLWIGLWYMLAIIELNL